MTQDLDNHVAMGEFEPEPTLDSDQEHLDYMAELRREDDERLHDVLRDIAVIRRVDMLADQAE